MSSGEFKVFERFPGNRVLIGWEHPGGKIIQVYREPLADGPDDRGEVYRTLEYGADVPDYNIWSDASLLVSQYIGHPFTSPL